MLVDRSGGKSAVAGGFDSEFPMSLAESWILVLVKELAIAMLSSRSQK
jgi:hypothetical protein